MSKDVLKLVDSDNKFVPENYSLAWEIAKQTKDIELVKAVANRIHSDMICEVFARITYSNHTRKLFNPNELLWIMLECTAVVTCEFGSQDRLVESFVSGTCYTIRARARSDFHSPIRDLCDGSKVYKNDTLFTTRVLGGKVTALDILDFLFMYRRAWDENKKPVDFM